MSAEVNLPPHLAMEVYTYLTALKAKAPKEWINSPLGRLHAYLYQEIAVGNKRKRKSGGEPRRKLML